MRSLTLILYKYFYFVILLLFLISCASVPSGRYIKLDSDYSYEEVALIFEIDQQNLLEHNRNKSFKNGEWIFIPYDQPARKVAGSVASSAINPAPHLQTGKYLWPVPSSKAISSGFGKRWGRKHEGIDIPARRGSAILAADSGVVVYSGNELGGYGQITVIAHKDGWFSVYAHAKKNYTRKGKRVSRGEVIAEVGSSGRSTGPHLHFEVRKNGIAFNPIVYLDK